MPWPTITATWSAPLPHVYTQGPHFRHIQFLCTCQTDVQEETFHCYHTVKTCWAHHIQTKTPGFFCLFSFYPFYLNSKHFCSLLVGVCILHMSAFSVLWTLLFLNLDFTDLSGFYITCGVGEKGGGGFKAVNWEIHSPTSWHSLRFRECSCIA